MPKYGKKEAMLTDQNKNLVCYSDKIVANESFFSCFKDVLAILGRYGVKTEKIAPTNDIWCRDYMPVQLSTDNFVQFQYSPKYLQDQPKLITPPIELEWYSKQVQLSEIVLDGGNIVNSSSKAIISDRIFSENPTFSKKKLNHILEELLGVEIFHFAEVNGDLTGHSDGYMRFLSEKKIVVNQFQNEFEYWKKSFYKMIDSSKLDFVEFPYFEVKSKAFPDSAIGSYLNFLEIGNLIVMPIFEIKGNKDHEAYDLMLELFPDRKIETVNINSIAQHGGLLNCCTWTAFRP